MKMTTRHLMALIAAAAVLTWILLGWKTDTHVASGVGHVQVRIAFLVTDAATGQPIDGATIRLDDPNHSSLESPYFLELQTGPDGRVATVHPMQCYESTGIPSGQPLSFRVDDPNWMVTTSAANYHSQSRWFPADEKGNLPYHDQAPARSMEIRLERAIPDRPVEGAKKRSAEMNLESPAILRDEPVDDGPGTPSRRQTSKRTEA